MGQTMAPQMNGLYGGIQQQGMGQFSPLGGMPQMPGMVGMANTMPMGGLDNSVSMVGAPQNFGGIPGPGGKSPATPMAPMAAPVTKKSPALGGVPRGGPAGNPTGGIGRDFGLGGVGQIDPLMPTKPTEPAKDMRPSTSMKFRIGQDPKILSMYAAAKQGVPGMPRF